MAMVNDQLFTPMLAYLSILNTLSSYERQNGVASYAVRGTASVKEHGDVAFENLFTGDQPSARRGRVRRGAPDVSCFATISKTWNSSDSTLTSTRASSPAAPHSNACGLIAAARNLVPPLN